MRWIIKALVQKFFSLIPFGFYLNQGMKYLRGTEEQPSDYFTTFYRLMVLEDIISHFGDDLKTKKILELGSGWSVEMPALAYSYGIKYYDMSDISDLRRDRTVKAKLSTLIDAVKKAENIYSSEYSFSIFKDKLILNKLKEISNVESFHRFQIITNYKYYIPIGIDSISTSYDAIISINTLEHIPPSVLKKGFIKILNSLNKGGISIHIIDHNDHFQYVDPTITRLNMYKFSELKWSLITSKFNYTNRLTLEDYSDILNSLNINFELIPLQFHDKSIVEQFLLNNPQVNKNITVSLSKLIIKKK